MSRKALERILYVEDEPDIQTVARLVLERVGGFTLHIASSGAEALAVVSEFAPDLVLLDVMMPGMDGPTVFKALRKNPATAEIPIVFLTAKIQPHEVQEYKNLGALGIVHKPFDPMTLADSLRRLWDAQ